MELNDAVRRMVRNYPGGIHAVCARMGKSPSTLDKEIRGAQGFKLGLVDAQEIAVLCHDAKVPGALELLSLMAHAVDQTLLPLPTDDAPPMTLERLGKLMHECGDLVAVVTKAKADGNVCDNELKQCMAQWAQLVSAGHALMQGLQAKNRETMARWVEGGGV